MFAIFAVRIMEDLNTLCCQVVCAMQKFLLNEARQQSKICIGVDFPHFCWCLKFPDASPIERQFIFKSPSCSEDDLGLQFRAVSPIIGTTLCGPVFHLRSCSEFVDAWYLITAHVSIDVSTFYQLSCICLVTPFLANVFCQELSPWSCWLASPTAGPGGRGHPEVKCLKQFRAILKTNGCCQIWCQQSGIKIESWLSFLL